MRTASRFRRALVAVPAAVSCAAAIAACGGSGATGYHNPHYPYGAPNVPFSMSKCMHANGVPDFPDPRSGPQGSGGGVGWPGGGPEMISSDVLLIMGQRLAGPAVAAAAKVCKEYMAPTGPPPAMSESQRVAALNFAACMRAHGLNFPDPTFSGGNEQLNLGPGLNPDSPAVQAASKACGGAPRP
jgi:hypothetical protein